MIQVQSRNYKWRPEVSSFLVKKLGKQLNKYNSWKKSDSKMFAEIFSTKHMKSENNVHLK